MPEPLSVRESSEALGQVTEKQLTEVIQTLHAVDPQQKVWKKSDGRRRFSIRQTMYWTGEAARVGLPSQICQRIGQRLDEHRSIQSRSFLIHNDFKIDNVAFDDNSCVQTPVVSKQGVVSRGGCLSECQVSECEKNE